MRPLECVYEFGEIAAAGCDIRDRVFDGRLVEPA
jgi:hypothetical protein